jgi:thioredoxin 1
MKINVDDHQTYASQFGVRSIPNLLVFKNGKVADQIIGAVPKSKLAQALDTVSA